MTEKLTVYVVEMSSAYGEDSAVHSVFSSQNKAEEYLIKNGYTSHTYIEVVQWELQSRNVTDCLARITPMVVDSDD